MILFRIGFTIVLIFTTIFCSAQIKFDSDGRVTKLNSDLALPPDINELADPARELKQHARELLLDKVEETLRIFTRSNYKRSLHHLYMFLWNKDSANIVDYLSAVKTALQKDGLSTMPVLLGLGASFNRAFNQNLADVAPVFTWQPGSDSYSGTLWKRDPLKGFFLDYHNNTLANLSANKEDVVEGGYFLIEQKLAADSLLRRYRENLVVDSFSHPLFDSLTAFHKQFNTSSELKSIRVLLGGEWFKQWFWVTGGELRFNPLHFSVRGFLENNSSYDLIKQFEQIINKRNDFALEKRIEKLSALFLDAKDTLTTSRQLLNKINLPSKEGYFNFSATGNIQFPFSEKDLTASLHTGEHKLIVVHNIPGNRKLRLSEKSASFSDRSAFQEGFDDVTSQLGELAANYARLTSYGTILDFFLPITRYNNSVVKLPTATQIEQAKHSSIPENEYLIIDQKVNKFWKGVNPFFMDTTTVVLKPMTESDKKADTLEVEVQHLILRGRPDDLLRNLLPQVLTAKGLFDVELFNIFTVDKTKLKDTTEIIAFNRQLGEYLAKLMKLHAERVKVDSANIIALLRVYNESSAPISRMLKSKDDDRPFFYSDSSRTTASDTSVEKTILPCTIDNSNQNDTAFITKFNYKVGKSRRFTLSAGIAYTLNSYDQSVAKLENGTIKITNSNRLARLTVGLNYYFGDGLFNQDNSFWGRGWQRTYAFVGIGIPGALENLYVGIGRDLFPGLKLTFGGHIARHNKYFIQNNEIIEERLRYQLAGPFFALKVDPTSLIKLFDVFKKK